MSGLHHGGRLGVAMVRFGGSRSDWLDLSTGINPHAYPLPELDMTAWQRLPDEEDERRLLQAARVAYGVRDDGSVVAANGTQAIIERVPELFVKQNVAIVAPTYGEHAHCWQKAGHSVALVDSVDEIADGSIGVVVNPNNPDGRIVDPDSLARLAGRLELLVVDEAFCDPVPQVSIVPAMANNVIVLRSFGKFFGLAGLRLGFAICGKDIAQKLANLFGPWAVSGPAIALGTAALADKAWIDAMRSTLANASDLLCNGLADSGLEIAGRNALFVYAKHAQAFAIHEHLARNHILVRDFPERNGFLRFGLCESNAQLKRLLAALRDFGS